MSSKLYRRFRTREERQAFYLLKNFRKAILDFKMIQPGDRILLGLSGGKDSLTLFNLLRLYRNLFRVEFEIRPVLVLTELQEEIRMNVPELTHYVESTGHGLTVKSIRIGLPEKIDKSLCFYCSWHRRKTLFLATEELNCNKLALGHHGDDIAETTLLNLFYHGRIERMEPKMEFFDGRFTLIRPMAYLDEKDIVSYASHLPVHLTTCTCPYGNMTKRSYMKDKIRELEHEIPKLKINLFRACANPNFVPLRLKRKIRDDEMNSGTPSGMDPLCPIHHDPTDPNLV